MAQRRKSRGKHLSDLDAKGECVEHSERQRFDRRQTPTQGIGHATEAAVDGDGRVLQAYRFALDPSPLQEDQLRSHCGAQRFAYNWGLRLVKANLDQRAAERSYGISESDLTPAVELVGLRDAQAFGIKRSRCRPVVGRTPRSHTLQG